jgi:hypothetical protein
MQLPVNTTNLIDRTTLQGYNNFLSHLSKSSRENRLSYTLDEFGWELGVYALRKSDADKVMAFLGDVGRAVRTEDISAEFEHPAHNPVIWLNGNIFPNVEVGVELGLCYDRPFKVVSSVTALSKKLFVVPKGYEGREDYSAWTRAIGLLSQRGEFCLEEIKDPVSGFSSYLGMNPDGENGVRFLAQVDINTRRIRDGSCVHIHRDFDMTLNEIFDRTLVATELVNGAYLVTERLPKLGEQRKDDLIAKLTEGINVKPFS